MIHENLVSTVMVMNFPLRLMTILYKIPSFRKKFTKMAFFPKKAINKNLVKKENRIAAAITFNKSLFISNLLFC